MASAGSAAQPDGILFHGRPLSPALSDELYHSAGEDAIQTATMEKLYDGGNGKTVEVHHHDVSEPSEHEQGQGQDEPAHSAGPKKPQEASPAMDHDEIAPTSQADVPQRKQSKLTEDFTSVVPTKSASVEQIETVEKPGKLVPGEKRLTRRERFRRHWKRFWCCYLHGLVVFLAILLPLFFLKVIPAIAQDIVNNTPLPIYGGAIKAYSPTQLEISLNSSLSIPAGICIVLDPITLSLFNRNTSTFSPYTSVSLPAMTIHGTTPITIANAIVPVTNQTELIAFLNNVFASATTGLSARGSTTAHLGALRARVELDKTIGIAALNNLAGFGLSDPRIVLPAEADGTNIVGNLSLPNWSALTLGLGNVTLNTLAGELVIGQATMLDVLAVPGNNTIPFRGEIYLDTIIANLARVLEANVDAPKDGNIVIGASGNATVVDGQHIPYLEAVLNSKYLIVAEIPVVTLLSDVLSSFLDGNTTLSGLLGVLKGALNSSGLLGALEPWLDKLNLTQLEGFDKRGSRLRL